MPPSPQTKTRRLDSLAGISERTGLYRKILNMTNVRHRHRRINPSPQQPDLFSWSAPPVSQQTPRIVLKISRRFGLSLAHAGAVANLAGFHEVRA